LTIFMVFEVVDAVAKANIHLLVPPWV